MNEGDILMALLRQKAFSKKTAVQLDNIGCTKEDLKRLFKDNRVKIVKSYNRERAYLTKIGGLVACGEWSLRKDRKDE